MMPPRPRPDLIDTWVEMWLASAVTFAHMATAPFDAFRETWDADEDEGAAHEPVPDEDLSPVSTVSPVRPSDLVAAPEVCRAATETCGNCRHFYRANSRAGECRLDGPMIPEAGHRAVWPAVVENEWCGRFLQVVVPKLTPEDLRGLN